MADEKFNIEVAVKAQLDTLEKVQRSLDEINKKVGVVSDSTSNLSNVWTGAMMNIGAQISDLAMKLPKLATATIEAFGKQEMAVLKLSSAIRSQGGNVSEILPIYESLAGEMQRLTTYGDEEVLALQSTATAMGVTSEQMDLCIKGAIGLSNVFGIGLNEAVRAAATVVQGKTDKLNEMIPALSKCKSETEKYAIAEKAMKDGFAQAKAEAESTSGRLKQAANAWGDLAEVAGETFAPVAIEVAGALKSVCEWFTRNSELTQILIGSLTSLAVGFAFSKIGGLANVASLFKLVASGMTGAKTASDALNVSLKANPLGIAMTAISGLGLIISSVSKSSEDLYNKNIEKSKEYRDSLDEEIAELEKWGVSVENNKKRTAEIKAEIAKLNAENMNLIPKASIGGFQKVSDSNLEIYQNNIAKIESLKKVLEAYSDVEGLGAKNTKQHAAALEAEKKILAESEKEMRAAKSEAEALKVIKEKLAETEKEVSRLTAEQKSGAWADKDREANANRLRQARLELVELGKKELEQNLKIAASKYDSLKTAELNKQRDLERQIAEAILKGNSEKAKSLKLELEKSKAQENEYSTISSYIAERKAEIKTEEDLKRVKEEAERYADATLKLERQKSESDRFLAEKAEKTKETQRSLETDILRLRAAGNEAGAKELEQQLRISQIESEIFENTRKEGMGREKLMKLSEDAKKNAAERYKLEKEITDEAERQNLAKDAQAKIEDILLTNKIEQLKAEGKLTEARELEREREIKRTLAGMSGLSEEQKKKLAETMRQTNAYRDRQQNMRKGGSGNGYGAGASYPAGAGSNGSYGGNSVRGYDGSAKYTGPTPPRRPSPATVSSKYLGLYEEWKAAGGSKSGESWTDYRMRRGGEIDAAEKAGISYGRTMSADANTPVAKQRDRAARTLSGIESQAKDMASRVAPSGALVTAANVPKESPRKAPGAGGEAKNESNENRPRRIQNQTKFQSTRQQSAQLQNPTLDILREILINVKSIRESD